MTAREQRDSGAGAREVSIDLIAWFDFDECELCGCEVFCKHVAWCRTVIEHARPRRVPPAGSTPRPRRPALGELRTLLICEECIAGLAAVLRTHHPKVQKLARFRRVNAAFGYTCKVCRSESYDTCVAQRLPMRYPVAPGSGAGVCACCVRMLESLTPPASIAGGVPCA